MSQPARIAIRAPPHLPYIQGYPGIPGTSGSARPPASVSGTVELRLGPAPIKAKWLRVEIRQHEGIPPGYPYPGEREGWRWIEGTDPTKTPLWVPPAGQEFGQIEQKDYAFSIPLPVSMPPSVDLGKGSGVKYELLACLCYKQKGGIFKSDALGYVKTSESIQIIKHETHSAWAVYKQPDSRTIMGPHGSAVQMTVQRPNSAFGPGDRLLLTATMQSARAKQLKLKGFEAHLYEIITVIPPPPPPGANGTVKRDKRKSTLPNSKRRPVAMARFPVDEKIQPGGEKSARLDMTPPPGTLLCTTRGARTVKLEYELEIKSVCESGIPELKVVLEYTVGALGRGQAEQTVRDIGYVEDLCPGVPPPSLLNQPGPHNASIPSFPPSTTQTPSPSASSVRPFSYFPQQPQQPAPASVAQPQSASIIPFRSPAPQVAATPAIPGYLSSVDRRKSSASTATTSTEFSRDTSNRHSRTIPRAALAFPSPAPNPAPQGAKGLARANTAWTYVTSEGSQATSPGEEGDQYAPSMGSHGSPRPGSSGPTTPTGQNVNRFSSSTFGRMDLSMSSASPSSPARQSPGRTKSSPGSKHHIRATDPRSTPPAPAQGTGSPSEYQAPPGRVLHSVTAISPVSPSTGPSSGSTSTATPNGLRMGGGAAQWPSAEQEKLRLYAEARSRAAATQAGAGHQLDQIGLGDASSPPPDYEFANPSSGAGPSAGGSGGARGIGGSARDGASADGAMSGGGSRFVAPAVPAAAVGAGAAVINTASRSATQNKDAQPRRVGSDSAGQPAAFSQPAPSAGAAAPSAASAGPGAVVRAEEPSRGIRHATDAGVVLMNGDAPIPYDEIFPPSAPAPVLPSSTSAAPSTPVIGQGSAPGTSSTATTVAPTASGSASRAAVPVTGQALTNGAAADKQQMKRYYEAQDRVSRAAGSGGAVAGSSSRQAAPANLAGPAASEKDQMKRYYDAQEKVARASGSVAAAPNGVGGSSTTSDNAQSSAGQAAASSQAISARAPGSVAGAGGEKDQMKRYYEAQDRVALAQTKAGGSSTIGAAPAVPPKDGTIVPASTNGTMTSVQAPAASGSTRLANGSLAPGSLSEKDQMRRYYEARDRVAGASGSTAPPASGNGTANQEYPSADQEKEAMRQRYEQASASVQRRRTSSAQTGSPVPSSSAQPKLVNAVLSNNLPSSAIPINPGLSDPSARSMQSLAIRVRAQPAEAGGVAPPPPLPSRPPQEYVRLLSPGPEEQARRQARQTSQGGAGAITETLTGEIGR